MQSFPQGFRALVLGASGGIGGAFVQCLQSDPRCSSVVGLHRKSDPAVDFDNEASVLRAAEALKAQGPFHLIINAAGLLHTPQFMPEKRLGQLHYAQMEATFRANAFGPALVLSAALATTGWAAGTATEPPRRRSTCLSKPPPSKCSATSRRRCWWHCTRARSIQRCRSRFAAPRLAGRPPWPRPKCWPRWMA